MKKVLMIVAMTALTAMTAASCATGGGGGGGGGGFVAGCYDSTTTNESLIYNGQIGTYKNAQFAINNGTCASDPVNDYVTVVTAADETSALAACQAGPDPAADVAAPLYSLGFTSLPAYLWYCTNPLDGGLLQAGDCFVFSNPVLSVQFEGQRDTLNNVSLHGAGNTTCTSTPDPAPAWTYVQRGDQFTALIACASISDTFTTAGTLATLFPSIPNDTYLCG